MSVLGNFTCSDTTGLQLAALGTAIYATVLGGILVSSHYVRRSLHDFATACQLERARQNDMISRLLMVADDLAKEEE